MNVSFTQYVYHNIYSSKSCVKHMSARLAPVHPYMSDRSVMVYGSHPSLLCKLATEHTPHNAKLRTLLNLNLKIAAWYANLHVPGFKFNNWLICYWRTATEQCSHKIMLYINHKHQVHKWTIHRFKTILATETSRNVNDCCCDYLHLNNHIYKDSVPPVCMLLGVQPLF